jgi:hypothetical protein
MIPEGHFLTGIGILISALLFKNGCQGKNYKRQI